MRKFRRKIFGRFREFTVYGSYADFLACGGDASRVLRWDELPKYRRPASPVVIGNVLSQLQSLEPTGKFLVLEDGQVVEIFGVHWSRRSRKEDVISGVSVDTPFGRYRCEEGEYFRELHGRAITVRDEAFLSAILATKDLYLGFQLNWPKHYQKLGGDRVKILQWLKRRKILSKEFLERLQQEMGSEKFNDLIQESFSKFPLKEATDTLRELLVSDDEEIRLKAASKIVDTAVDLIDKGKPRDPVNPVQGQFLPTQLVGQTAVDTANPFLPAYQHDLERK